MDYNKIISDSLITKMEEFKSKVSLIDLNPINQYFTPEPMEHIFKEEKEQPINFNDIKNMLLSDFMDRCKSGNIPQSEMYNYIKDYTHDFDKKAFDYLRRDLNKFTDNIKFTLILETESDGSVDRTTTVKNYIEKQQEFLSLGLTPRQKIDFVLNDIDEKKLNYYDNESIFSLEINGFLRFCDLVEKEYKELDKPQTKIENSPKPFAGSKIIKIYDPIKVHKEFKKELKCDYNTFKAWFVDSVICDKQMSWNYDDGNKAQLIKFIFILCGGWEPAQINTVFKTKVDSNNNRAKELNANLLQRLEKCTIK